MCLCAIIIFKIWLMKTSHLSNLDHLLPWMALDNRATPISTIAKAKDPANMTEPPMRATLLGNCSAPANPRIFLFLERERQARLGVTVALDMIPTAVKTQGTKEAAAVAGLKTATVPGNP